MDAAQRKTLQHLLQSETDWLVDRVLSYAKEFGYTKYTSTLREAWFLSIRGLSASLARALELESELELRVDERLVDDPLCRFGIEEARKHRERGIRLSLFMALMKYYERAYFELATTFLPDPQAAQEARSVIARAFARIETSLIQEWESLSDGEHLQELQATNRRMTNEKNKYLTTFESLFSPSLIFDKSLRVVDANHAALKLSEPCATPGANYYGHIDTDGFFAWLKPHVAEFQASGAPTRSVPLSADIAGQSLEYVLFLTRMLDESEKFSGVVATLQDVTEGNRTAREHAELQRKFFHAAKLASLGTLVAGIAHEINNPLAILRANTDLVLGASLSGTLTREQLQQRLEQQQRALQRIVNIISGLKSYARMDSDERSGIAFDQCVLDTLPLCEQLFAKRGVTVKADLGATGALVTAAPGRLSQVVMNLLSNAADAIEAAAKPGCIRVETRTDSQCVRLTLSDTGCGMTDEVRERMFDPFFTTKTVGKGMGLGMSITLAIIADCGGHIDVESTPGVGTTIHVVLPLHAAEKRHVPQPERRAGAEPVKVARILLVDDEMEVCGALGDLLRAEGHEVETTSSAEEGIELLRYRTFDLVITDLRTHHLDGIAFLRALSRSHSEMPVVVMTGSLLDECSDEERNFLRNHAFTILRKPASQEELREAVQHGLHTRRLAS